MTYNEFIQNIINTRGQWAIPVDEYKEMHHIVPRCMGGLGDTKNNYFHKNSHHENCIWFHPLEHFIAHKLLVVENPNNYSLVNAFMLMANINNNFISAEEYADLRLKYANTLSIKYSGEGNPFYGKQLSQEAKQKISIANTERFISSETRNKISEANKGKNKDKKYVYNKDGTVKSVLDCEVDEYLANGWILGNNRSGIKLSKEIKQKISTGTKLGMQKWKEENYDSYIAFCENTSKKNKGKHLSNEAKKLIGLKNSGKNNGMYKNGLSTNEYKLLHKLPIKRVLCVELNIIYDSVSDASKILGIGSSHISCCAHKRPGFKTAGGYHWEFIDE